MYIIINLYYHILILVKLGLLLTIFWIMIRDVNTTRMVRVVVFSYLTRIFFNICGYLQKKILIFNKKI